MGRIRTIKPEFWSDEEVGELSPNARLLFIATWNLADDEGLLKWTPSFIKAQVFAYDDLSKDDVQGFMSELCSSGLVYEYQDSSAKKYGWVVNFRKHQKIDKPQPPKHPIPSLQNPEIRRRYAARDRWKCHICGGDIDPVSNVNHEVLSLDHVTPKSLGGSDCPSNIRAAHFGCNASKRDRSVADDSAKGRRTVDEPSPLEGKGREGIKDQGNGSGIKEETTVVADATPDCPHDEIIEIYHSRCPTLPRVRDWTDRRRKILRQRWREKPDRQDLGFWMEFFGKVGSSPFLCGVNERTWTADIDWLLEPKNFTKVVEGRYNSTVRQLSDTTRKNLAAAEAFANGR